MPDKKLADLNYKTLHMILPCGDTLSRWNLISSDKCIQCNKLETILHLIYGCNYAQASWDIIHKALNITIFPEFFVCGKNGFYGRRTDNGRPRDDSSSAVQ